jgi:hypothetical protein
MNIFQMLFETVRGKGAVEEIKSGKSVSLFVWNCVLLIVLCGTLYGYAIGFGVSQDAILKNGLKTTLILLIGCGMAIPPSILAFVAMLPGVKPRVVSLAVLCGVTVSALVLGICAPFSFLYSIVWSFGGDIVSVVIVDIVILAGIYAGGSVLYYCYTDNEKNKLVVPLIMTAIFALITMYLLIQFFTPYLVDTEYFCKGSLRLHELLALKK